MIGALAAWNNLRVKNDAKGAKMVTKVRTFRDCALYQWIVR